MVKETGAYPPVYGKNGNKTEDIKDLMRNGKNVVTTQALFKRFDKELRELSEGYTAYMDEVIPVFDTEYWTKGEVGDLLQKGDIVNDDGLFVFREEESTNKVPEDCGQFLAYNGRYKDILEITSANDFYFVNNSFVVLLKPEVFTAFKEVIIFTYMFEHQFQRMYFDYFNIPYKVYGLDNCEICEYKFEIPPNMYKLEIYEGKLNRIGDRSNYLSKRWYIAPNTTRARCMAIRNNIENMFKHIKKCSNKDKFWTVYKGVQEKVQNKNLTTSFLSCNARGTNDYSDRHYMAYCINPFMNPVLKTFLSGKGVEFDEDAWSNSEFVQWVMRSALRRGEYCYIYVPSARIRENFIEWGNRR